MASGFLETDEEVEDDGEEDKRHECHGNIDECERGGLDERVVHGGLVVFENDRALGEEGGDFGHGREGREEECARYIVSRNSIRRDRKTHKKSTPPREKYAEVDSGDL